jgi:PAS domain S-box-containing protein
VLGRRPPAPGFRELVEQMPLPVYVSALDRTSHALYVSPSIVDLLGYPLEEWHAMPELFEQALHPDDRERVLAAVAAAKAGGAPYREEYRLRRKDGSELWVEDQAVTVRDRRGEPLHWQGYLVDISGRKRAELELGKLLRRTQSQNERLRELDRMKDEFLALVSHELRTPLTSIRGYLELLGDQDAPVPESERGQFLQVIERNAQRLQRLVEDLLLVAQADAHALHLDLEEIELARLAVDCVEAAEPEAAARKLELACTVAGDPLVVADAGRLSQVVDNLLSNALKFTPAGGAVHLRVSVDGDAALVEVADTGMGIPEGEQAELFERFFRTRRAQREAIAGVGLGLSIAKALVEAHGGRVAFTSTEGAGTTFAVRLPLAATASRSS